MRTKIFSTIIIALFVIIQVRAQQVNEQLSTAGSSYAAGDLENARFALQEALSGVNQAIGQDILDLLPKTLGEMNMVSENDEVTGTNMAFAGLYVNRDYNADSSFATVEVISDSPMLATINALLAMPMVMNSDPNQKRIKIDNYKAMLNRSEYSGKVAYEIQMPFSNSLLTFKTEGIEEEAEVIAMANSLPIAEIVQLAQ